MCREEYKYTINSRLVVMDQDGRLYTKIIRCLRGTPKYPREMALHGMCPFVTGSLNMRKRPLITGHPLVS